MIRTETVASEAGILRSKGGIGFGDMMVLQTDMRVERWGSMIWRKTREISITYVEMMFTPPISMPASIRRQA